MLIGDNWSFWIILELWGKLCWRIESEAVSARSIDRQCTRNVDRHRSRPRVLMMIWGNYKFFPEIPRITPQVLGRIFGYLLGVSIVLKVELLLRFVWERQTTYLTRERNIKLRIGEREIWTPYERSLIYGLLNMHCRYGVLIGSSSSCLYC